jgi:hypothetical protein
MKAAGVGVCNVNTIMCVESQCDTAVKVVGALPESGISSSLKKIKYKCSLCHSLGCRVHGLLAMAYHEM